MELSNMVSILKQMFKSLSADEQQNFLDSLKNEPKDIHYVTYQYRTTWEMCKLLDQKYLHSSRRTIEDFYREATKNQWIKN